MSGLGFVHRGTLGQIEVQVVANTDPPSLGCDDDNRTFPACTASVHYPGGGYQCMFGWVQLVRSTDALTEDFEMDPNFLFPDADVPYCYYGYKPTLFDCPGRKHTQDMDWVANSFLAASPIEPGARIVTPLQGFAWGFTRRNQRVDVLPLMPLVPADWDNHRPYLGTAYPEWQFAAAPNWHVGEI
jgi:hypothetical protein